KETSQAEQENDHCPLSHGWLFPGINCCPDQRVCLIRCDMQATNEGEKISMFLDLGLSKTLGFSLTQELG
ncbi:MAG TPA: hypothetical protein PK187_06115, partial [Candidatus Syntrophosphaera thermopropionivorans]|nr:hypothetical protein [Candidatus Syntrophosphaera thermopropionivorans]